MNESKKVNGTGMVPDVLENPCLGLNRYPLKQRQAFLVRWNLNHPPGVSSGINRKMKQLKIVSRVYTVENLESTVTEHMWRCTYLRYLQYLKSSVNSNQDIYKSMTSMALADLLFSWRKSLCLNTLLRETSHSVFSF